MRLGLFKATDLLHTAEQEHFIKLRIVVNINIVPTEFFHLDVPVVNRDTKSSNGDATKPRSKCIRFFG